MAPCRASAADKCGRSLTWHVTEPSSARTSPFSAWSDATGRTPRPTRTPTWSSSARRSTGAPRTGPGTRFGPQFIRQSCYLPHDGSRPSLAMRVDGLRDLNVYDAGDVEMYSGDAERSVRATSSTPSTP
ncbi:arginase family protein [Nonomuraea dietziae]|uniref:arginase family protein n=1 Tax=Nonomuraea dietziae TaxID=65515 RepID=UPI0031D866D0